MENIKNSTELSNENKNVHTVKGAYYVYNSNTDILRTIVRHYNLLHKEKGEFLTISYNENGKPALLEIPKFEKHFDMNHYAKQLRFDVQSCLAINAVKDDLDKQKDLANV